MEEPHSDIEVDYVELERLRAENYHLKRQLKHVRDTNRAQKKLIASFEKKLKEQNKKPHYRNGRKRGANGFNG